MNGYSREDKRNEESTSFIKGNNAMATDQLHNALRALAISKIPKSIFFADNA